MNAIDERGAKPYAGSSRLSLLDVDDPRWLQLVRRSPDATLFHHPAWVRLVADCYGYDAHVAAVTAGDAGQVAAGVPIAEVRTPLQGKRWLALPFTDHCPPLGGEGARRLLAMAIAEAARLLRVSSVEVRGELSGTAGFVSSLAAVRHTLTLSPAAPDVYARLSSMHQRNIRRAMRSGVEVERGSSTTDLDIFYELHVRTRRRHGVPIQPRRFFDLLQHRILEAGYGFLLTARLDGVPLASAVFLVWNGVLIYKYGASDERLWQHRANNLVLWSAIKWGCETGCRTFDLGRTDLEDTGLRSFKDGWGATEEPLHHSETGHAGGNHTRAIAQRVLSLVIRRSHPWLSRALGELLYRYAA